MGRVYTGTFTEIAVTAAQDLFEIAAPSDSIVYVHEIELYNLTEVGDAAEEQLALEMVRGIGATSGSGGATVTPQPLDDGDPAFGGTVERNNTTKMVAGGGSLESLAEWGWNVRIPFDKLFTPELRPVISPSDRLTVELKNAPSDSITMQGTIWFEEIGG
jgi:hypothetical protein